MNTWVPISAALHIATLLAIFMLFGNYSLVNPDIYEIASKVDVRADALSVAWQIGRLDVVSLVLTLAGLLLAFLGLYGFIAAKGDAVAESKRAAVDAIPDQVKSWMRENASMLIRQCLSDSEIAASLHAEILKLGIRDAYQATDVDTDADIKETE